MDDRHACFQRIFMFNKLLVRAHFLVCALTACSAAHAAWQLPPDHGVLEPPAIAEILSTRAYPVTSSYRQEDTYLDFDAFGQ